MNQFVVFVAVFNEQKDSAALEVPNIAEQCFGYILSIGTLFGTWQGIQAIATNDWSVFDQFSA